MKLSITEFNTVIGLLPQLDMDQLNDITELLGLQRNRLGMQMKRSLKIGDRVSFEGRRGYIEGTVEKVSIKNVVVDVGGPQKWRVPASMLTKVA
jgi:hypothetical protein